MVRSEFSLETNSLGHFSHAGNGLCYDVVQIHVQHSGAFFDDFPVHAGSKSVSFILFHNRFQFEIHHASRRSHDRTGSYEARQLIYSEENLFHDMLRLHIAAHAIPMAHDRVYVFIVNAMLSQDLPGLDAVLIREHLIIDIMHESYSSPLLLILTQQAREMPHHAFDRQSMGNEGRRVVVLAQQFVRFISRWFQVSLLLIQIHLYLVKSYQTASKKSTGSAGLLTSPNRAIVQR